VEKSYPALAFEILSRFMDDVPDLRGVVERTYSRSVFGSDEVTPLTTLEPGPAPARPLQRADAGVQGHRDAADRPAVRADPGRARRYA
jgi:hypothetical protein